MEKRKSVQGNSNTSSRTNVLGNVRIPEGNIISSYDNGDR